jgi:DNA-binding MarR family transcriptional regulator
MDKDFHDNMKLIATDIRKQAAILRVSTFLSFIYTADIINRYLDIGLSKYPFGRTSFGILHHLILNGGTMTPTDLSKRVFRSKYAVTRTVDELEKHGFVRRGVASRDRREKAVHITREGLEFVENALVAERRHLGEIIFHPLRPKRLEELRQSLRYIRKHVLDLIDSAQAHKFNKKRGSISKSVQKKSYKK